MVYTGQSSRQITITPWGYGREIYFWSFVVAVMVFALGAGVSLYEGIAHILNPEPIKNATVNYAVLGLSALFDGTTWWIALRNFKGRMRYADIFRAIRKSKDPSSFMVLFEDSAALTGLMIAFAGTYFSVRLDLPTLDGVASILISAVLAVTAALLARETKGLLMGEAADQPIVDSIMHEGVAHANGVITVHLAPEQIIVALSLEFADELRTPDIEFKVVELERRLPICIQPSLPFSLSRKVQACTRMLSYVVLAIWIARARAHRSNLLGTACSVSAFFL
jgi:divalent metal cation (Fe/Co/Zn/Cd) transporter